MNEQLKQQAHEEFEKMLDYPSDNNLTSISDEKIMKENEDKHLYNSYAYPESIWEIDDEKVLSFIDSIIDKTVQMTEERVVGMVQEAYLSRETNHLQTNQRLFGLTQEVISLITNKSDINK